MIETSPEFKTAVRGYAKQINFIITDGTDEITSDDDIKSVEISEIGNICKTLMRMATIEYFGDHSYLDKYVQLSFGLGIPEAVNLGSVTISTITSILTLTSHGLITGEELSLTTTGAFPNEIESGTHYYAIVIDENTFYLADSYQNAMSNMPLTLTGSSTGTNTLYHYPHDSIGSTEFISYGSFKVTNQRTTKGSDVVTLTAYDKMVEALQKYDLELSYPMSMLEFLQAVCDRFGWTLATTSFPNNDLVITAELFSNLNLPFRDILDQVAEASGSIIRFNTSDELVVIQIGDTVLETLDSGDLNKLDLEEIYGPVAAVILSRQPQGDDIIQSI